MKSPLRLYAILVLVQALGFPTVGLSDEAASKPQSGKGPIRNTTINVDVLDYSWKSGLTWEQFNKTECIWEAKVKNNNPEPRHICINYEFLDSDSLAVFQNGKCDVVPGNSEGIFTSSVMISSRLVKDVAKSNVVALEAHRLHSFVTTPAQ